MVAGDLSVYADLGRHPLHQGQRRWEVGTVLDIQHLDQRARSVVLQQRRHTPSPRPLRRWSDPGELALRSAVLVGVGLFATGTTVGVLTGGPLVRRGLRQLVIGAAAAAVTDALGRVFSATLG
jgi:hypothetical protein